MSDEHVVTRERTLVLEGLFELRERFGNEVSRPRLLALVSPACPVCLDGIALIIDGLRRKAGMDIALHIVWTPVLDADSFALAKTAAQAVEDDVRVWQYWDANRAISTAAHDVLALGQHGRAIAWDVYMFYRAGVRWPRQLPVPDTWLHQLRIVEQPSLDPETLREALEQVSG